ncbi:DUF3105 domain-containing protein [Geodermatophilus sp. DSM 44513]|uniref:DUF3105 domain-containing protein n=1 Tax=Geodermatophilus sp. DSM 44513 TaxID=1528104 RepID=UPI001277BBC5|nr:DUF3105 domain-containing protein [Geodermatophilus sp. DSM 44513]WNV74622.1 DUF3105 domain-containing protein [Geodermatophilus sp. DSM 44513]
MAKDRKPADGRPRGGSRPGGAGTRGGRTRPVTDVVAPQRPWGLIAAAVAVALFAAAVLVYAVQQVNQAEAARVDSVDEIPGVATFDYAAGQQHVTTPVAYEQSPPVGGPHAPPPDWADCTGTVYDVDIRHENAVHSLEHGAVWITYDPARVDEDGVATLAELVEGTSGRMMSPYEGLTSPVSIQSWNHQLAVDSATDPRIQQFADFLTLNPEFYPEVGASCENPVFAADPVLETVDAGVPTDGGATPAPGAEPTESQ